MSWCAVRRALALAAVATAFAPPGSAAAAPPPNPALYNGLQWRNIGPNLGGRSIAVAGSIARPSEYYFGATGGGLWKSTNGGTSWAPVTDQKITSSSVGAIDVCPSNPDVVMIGMGEVQFRGDVIPGDGVYKTTDGGATWRHMGLSDAQMVGRVRFDPTNCDRVFVAALGHAFGLNNQGGIFRSTNGGESWQRVLARGEQTGGVDLSIDASNPNVIYSSLWQAYRRPWLLNSGGEHSGLFKSTDGGTTWTEISRNPGLPTGTLGKLGVSVSPVDPNRVFAIVEAAGGGVFRSDDAGATWQLINDDAGLMQRPFYYMRVYADPVNRDRVYVLNVSFFRSNDAGATFSTISTPHGDNHDLWIAPNNNNRMIEGNDGGANVSTNGGANWTNQNYSTAQMYHVITTNDDPYLVCGGQQDRNTICVSSTGGPGSFGVGGGESGYIAVDPRDSNVFYAGSYGGFLTRFVRGRAGGTRDVNAWPDEPMGHPARDLVHRFQWTFPIMTNPAEPDAVFIGSQHVLKSTDGGMSWQKLSGDLSYADPDTLGDSGGPVTKDQTSIEYYALVFAIAPSTLDPKVIWAGTDDGRVHVTRQGGGTWTEVTPPGLQKFTRVSIIDAGHHDTQTAYVAAHNYRLDDFAPYAWRTHDGGQTWTKITTGIADGDFLWAIREDPVKPGLLYAASQHRVYVSFDDGDSWQTLRNNMPDTSVQDLVVKNGDIVVATHGRGFYVLDDAAVLLRRLDANTTPEDVADFQQTVPPPTPVPTVNVPPAMIPPTTPAADAENDLAVLRDPNNVVRRVSNNVSVNYTLKQAATTATATFLAANGVPLSTVTLPTTAGTRNVTWNLRYANAVSFPGLIYWQGSNTGPRMPLGTYSVRLTVDGQSLTQQFEILADSRIPDVSAADIAEQFALGLKVRNRINDANQAVINIRDCTGQIDARIASDGSLAPAGGAIKQTLSEVENEIYQTRLRSGQDPLNYPIKLNNKLAGLPGVIESAEGRPTAQTYEVYELVSGLLQVQLSRLAGIVATDVWNFNQLLQARNLAPIACASYTAVTEATGAVSGNVPATLSLTLGMPATFGAFTPGVADDYDASTTANVISTAGDAALSVADPSATATGRLVNGAFALPQPLLVRAASPGGQSAGALAPVGGSANPTPLLSYGGPLSNDPVALAFRQSVGASDALRTGTYSKTLTFTLSTTTP